MIGTFIAEPRAWAAHLFSGSSLPDERLVDRLVAYAASQCGDPRGSTARVSGSDKAAREGAYRLLENPRVVPADIDEGPFQITAELCRNRPRILAVQDTTGVGVASELLRAALKSIGSPTGYLVHSTLMIDGQSGEVLGLIDQQRWLREKKKPTKEGEKKNKRAYEDRESARWASADRAMRGRLYDDHDVIVVADREADVYEFLAEHIDLQHRFVIRAQANRRTEKKLEYLFDAARSAPILGERVIMVEQRGAVPKKIPEEGRPGRQRRFVRTQIQACQVELQPPKDLASQGMSSLRLNVVRVSEVAPLAGADEPALEWILLTTEPVKTFEQVVQVVKDYEHRWIIEEFHKCWKTGCRLEARPLQSLEAVERMMSITAPIAVRILQLHTAARSDEVDKSTAVALTEEETKCLWASTESKPFPSVLPSARWALHALARLGGWFDTKKTGRIGWETLWYGWSRFQERFIGWKLAR